MFFLGRDSLKETRCALLPAAKTLEWTLEYKDYKEQLIDQAALMLTLSGRVKETQQVVATQFSFRLRTPDLVVKVNFQLDDIADPRRRK